MLPNPLALFDETGIGDASVANGTNPLTPAAVGAAAVPWREADGADVYIGTQSPTGSSQVPLIVALGTGKAAQSSGGGGRCVAFKKRSETDPLLTYKALANDIITAANNTGVTIGMMFSDPQTFGGTDYKCLFGAFDNATGNGLAVILHSGKVALYAKHAGGTVLLVQTTSFTSNGKYIVLARFGGGVAESGYVNNVPFPSGGRTDAITALTGDIISGLHFPSNSTPQFQETAANVAKLGVWPGLVSDEDFEPTLLAWGAQGTVPLVGYQVVAPVVDMANNGTTLHVGHSDGGTGPITHRLDFAAFNAPNTWTATGLATKSNPVDGASQNWDTAAYQASAVKGWFSVFSSDGNATNDARSNRVYFDTTAANFNPSKIAQIAGRAVPGGDVVYAGDVNRVGTVNRWPASEIFSGVPQATVEDTTNSFTLETVTRLSGGATDTLKVIDAAPYDGVAAQNSLQIDHTGLFLRGDGNPVPLAIGFNVIGGAAANDRQQTLIDIVDKADRLGVLLYIDTDNSIKLKLSAPILGEYKTVTHTEPGPTEDEAFSGSLVYNNTTGQWVLTVRGVELNALSGPEATAWKWAVRHLEGHLVNENTLSLFGRAVASVYYQTWPNGGDTVRPFTGNIAAFWFGNAVVRVGQALPSLDTVATIDIDAADLTGEVVSGEMQGTLYPVRPDADATPAGIPKVQDVVRAIRADFFSSVNDMSLVQGARGRCTTLGWSGAHATLVQAQLGYTPANLYHDFSANVDLSKSVQVLTAGGAVRMKYALGASYSTPYSSNPSYPGYDRDDEDFAAARYAFPQDQRSPADKRKWAVETTDRVAAWADVVGIANVVSVCVWNEPMGAFFLPPDAQDLNGSGSSLTNWNTDPTLRAAEYAAISQEGIPLLRLMLTQKATAAGVPVPPILVCEHAGSEGDTANGSQVGTRAFYDALADMIADHPEAAPDGVGNHRYDRAWLETDNVEEDVRYFEGLLGLDTGTLYRAYTEWGLSGVTASGQAAANCSSAWAGAWNTTELIRMLRHGAKYTIMYKIGPHNNGDLQATTDGNILVPSLTTVYPGPASPSNVRATGNVLRLFDSAMTAKRVVPTNDSTAAARKLPVLIQATWNPATGNYHVLIPNRRFAPGNPARLALTFTGLDSVNVLRGRRVDPEHAAYNDMGVAPPQYLEDDAQSEMVTEVAGNVVSLEIPPAATYELVIEAAGTGPVPGSPAVTVRAGTGGVITPTWEAVSGATAYKVERRFGNGAYTVLAASTNALFYADTGAANHDLSAIYYRITAHNIAGDGTPTITTAGGSGGLAELAGRIWSIPPDEIADDTEAESLLRKAGLKDQGRTTDPASVGLVSLTANGSETATLSSTRGEGFTIRLALASSVGLPLTYQEGVYARVTVGTTTLPAFALQMELNNENLRLVVPGAFTTVAGAYTVEIFRRVIGKATPIRYGKQITVNVA